jgi:hypothetical protein
MYPGAGVTGAGVIGAGVTGAGVSTTRHPPLVVQVPPACNI